MNKKLAIIIFITSFLLLGAVYNSQALKINEGLTADSEAVKELDKVYVSRIIDGDTIELTDGRTIRFIGVDTPETKHPSKPVEKYGLEAAEYTKNQLKGEVLYLEYDVQEYDDYDRTLAYVFLADGTFFNAKLLAEGYARLLTVPPNVEYVDLFTKLVKEARENNQGLWAAENKEDSKKEELAVISWDEAGEYIGEKISVEGKVVDTYDSGEAIFLNFAQNYQETFTAVIFANDRYKFDNNPAQYYNGQEVRVKGTIKEYEGAPEIIIEKPGQIKKVRQQDD
jgi:micrococcal nuclease